MKTCSAKHLWIVDAVLFTGFLLAFWMDLTGLSLHQWLGVLVGVLVAYHLLVHWSWVKRTVTTLFKRWVSQPFAYLLLDSVLGLSFAVMMVTGLVLSTWLNLELAFYEVWRVTHILSSIWALVLLVFKLVLHWRWITCVLERFILPARRAPQSPRGATVDFARREFLGVMGVAGVAAGLSMLNAGKALFRTFDAPPEVAAAAPTQPAAMPAPRAVAPTATPTSAPTAPGAAAASSAVGSASAPTATPSPTATPQPTATLPPTATPLPTQTCVVRCPRGCSYPGRCRKYTDRNGNGKCDWGECL